jgi:hypothetical protein
MKDIKFYDLSDDLDFGRYEATGKTVEQILEEDPGYIRWLMENSTNISFSEDVESALERNS